MQGLFTLAQQGQDDGAVGLLTSLLPLILIIVVFYVLFLRPQQKRNQQERQMQQALAVGQDVLTKSGIYGTIVEVHDNDVELEISPGTRIRMVKAGVGEVITPQDPSGIEDHPDFPGGGPDNGGRP